jgi:muconolactone D-isomerase
MPEFLVRIDVDLPPELSERRRAELIAAERARGRELRRGGAIVRIWRLPGGLRNVGVWSAPDVAALDALIGGLPLRPWMQVDVTQLAPHPLEEEDGCGASGPERR